MYIRILQMKLHERDHDHESKEYCPMTQIWERLGKAEDAGSVTLSDPPSSIGTRGISECKTSVINGL